ncbi:MAG TPA: hypothetical protein VFC07_13040 [Verrucomicrobiae bacterium]|nr:hypothetical protein [Verrucomicrobiae bacterium]
MNETILDYALTPQARERLTERGVIKIVPPSPLAGRKPPSETLTPIALTDLEIKHLQLHGKMTFADPEKTLEEVRKAKRANLSREWRTRRRAMGLPVS